MARPRSLGDNRGAHVWDTRLCWGHKSGQRGCQGAVADDPSSTRVTLAKEHGIPPLSPQGVSGSPLGMGRPWRAWGNPRQEASRRRRRWPLGPASLISCGRSSHSQEKEGLQSKLVVGLFSKTGTKDTSQEAVRIKDCEERLVLSRRNSS